MGFLWLRDEVKLHERRTLLLPNHAQSLVQLGHTIIVEQSQQRIFPDSAYVAAGCILVKGGTWVDADTNFYILGLKNLPEADFPLRHKHIYYAHCYKGQPHSRGGGTLLDCEYLTDHQGKAVAVENLGYLAGYVGAAMAIQFYIQKQLKQPLNVAVPYFSDQQQLISYTLNLLDKVNISLSLVILGYQGNAGAGAVEFCRTVNITPSCWNRTETSRSSVLSTLNQFEIIVNCIKSDKSGAPFLLESDLYSNNRLSILADVTCDVGLPTHRFPFYSTITTFENPCLTVGPQAAPLDVIAIDNVSAWLPVETSQRISEPLFLQLKALLDDEHVLPYTWQKTKDIFLEKKSHAC